MVSHRCWLDRRFVDSIDRLGQAITNRIGARTGRISASLRNDNATTSSSSGGSTQCTMDDHLGLDLGHVADRFNPGISSGDWTT